MWRGPRPLNQGGSCFGLDVTASLLYQEHFDCCVGEVTDLGQTGAGAPTGINFSTPAYTPVFSLAWYSNITMNGLTLPLVQVLHLNLMAQMSTFATTTVLSQSQEYARESGPGAVLDFMSKIETELGAGRRRSSASHSPNIPSWLTASRATAQGGWYINCYNPNDPVQQFVRDRRRQPVHRPSWRLQSTTRMYTSVASRL